MEWGHFSDETQIIKFAAESYMGVGGDPVILFTKSAEWLYSCYKNSGDEICLKASMQIINAYMEIGLLYEVAKETFDKILSEMGVTVEEEFPKRVYSKNIIKRKKNHIREVLGYWPKSKKCNRNAEWISIDILKKVENKEVGCFYYGKRDDVLSFELMILEEESYLMDLERKKIYVFEQ
ncbi:MAG: hypothetical protein ACI4DV_07380 [Lachnospiraceae bacterium]